MHRGLTVLHARHILSNESLTSQHVKDLCILCWLSEVLQAVYTIWDDIIDDYMTHCGQFCWLHRQGIGMNSINEACIIRPLIFSLLRVYFGEDPRYARVADLFLDMGLRTELGQLTHTYSASVDVRSDL
ncbi:Farnesyl pyrophosphate synthetase [Aspergillus tanneri]|uniref:Farnesyl pyrophosphate synthetase n=1 Tax=Aspergillus tanneri TaxID=1220188 RepID=A0A5M9MHK9_9EURO|nr:Farnesyl pyrophosphate synthetase [Aspergillus tanneri]KAA8646458.1 Farnesyl pyrophosphate synthetase [Aspergillus tanneri]